MTGRLKTHNTASSLVNINLDPDLGFGYLIASLVVRATVRLQVGQAHYGVPVIIGGLRLSEADIVHRQHVDDRRSKLLMVDEVHEHVRYSLRSAVDPLVSGVRHMKYLFSLLDEQVYTHFPSEIRNVASSWSLHM